MKKLHYLVGLLLCISCTQNQKNTPSEKETYKIVLECDDVVCPDEFLSENIKTETLDEIILKNSIPKNTKQAPSNISRFNFNTNESVTLIAEQKTKISIPPNSFRYKDSKEPVKGKVKIEVKEYFKKSEFIKAKLTSQTQNELLESRGMIYITAKADGKECELIDGKQMKVDFPVKKIEDGFKYFKGKENENGNVTWKIVETNIENRPDFKKLNPRIINNRRKRVNVSFSSYISSNGIDESNNSNAFSSWLLKEFTKKFKDKSLEEYHKTKNWRNQYTFKRAISFDFDTGNNKAIVKSNVQVRTDYFLDLKKVLRKVPQNICLEGLNTSQKHKNMIFVTVNVDARDNFDIDTFEKKYNFEDYDGYVDYISIDVDDLKWINIDKFLNFPSEEVTPMYVNIGKSEHADVKLVFKNRNSVMAGNLESGKIVFKNIPKEEEVFIIASKTKNGKSFFSITPAIASENIINLNFQPYTEKSYQRALNKLNNS